MPQRIPGIKKETKSTASVASSDINSSDIKSLISAMEDWVSEFKSASKLKSTSKSDAEALNKAVKELSGVIKDSKELEEQREDLLKKSANLSEDQRKRVMEAFDSKVISQYKKLSKVTDIVDPLALSLTSDKFGKKRADIYTKSLQETVSILKRIDQRAEDRSKKEGIVAQNKKAKDSVSKFGSDAIDTVLNPLFHSLLGPLQLFTDPLEKLFKVDLYQIPKSLAVLRKKTPASRERVLAEGGVFGAGMVLIHDAINGQKGKSSEGDSILDNITEGITEGLSSTITTGVSGALSSISISSIASGFVSAIPWLLGVESLAVLGLGLWEGFSGQYKETLESVTLNVKNLSKEDIDSDSSGTISGSEVSSAVQNEVDKEYVQVWNPLNWIFHPKKTAQTIGASVGEGTEEGGFFGGLAGLFSSIFQYTDTLRELENSTMLDNAPDVARASDDLGILYRLLGQSGRYKEQEKLKERYYNDEDLANKYLGGLPDSSRVLGLDFYDTNSAWSRIDTLEDMPFVFTQELKGLSSKYAEYLNDAVIYKDNNVYIPHPDDNIVLTKSDVTAGGIDESTLDTIISILSSIDTHTANPSTVTSVVNNVNGGQSGAMDFSGLRL